MALALDGKVHGNASGSSSLGVSLSTGSGSIVIVVATVNGGPVTGIADTDGGGLETAFAQHATYTVSGASRIELWWGRTSAVWTSNTITVSQTNASFITVDAFGISGADTSSNPFDGNASIPDTGGTVPRSVTTDTADTFIVGGVRFASVSSYGAGTDFTLIYGANFQLTEYRIVSSADTYSVPIGGSGTVNGAIATAIKIASAGGGGYTSPLALLGVGT